MNFFYAIFFALLFFSCGNKELSVEEYISYIDEKENGLFSIKEVENYVFELQYRPIEYIVALKSKNLNAKEFEQKKLELDHLQHFNLKIIAKGKNQEMLRTGTASEQEYQYRINYFSYEAQNDIKLIDGKDTLKCVLYHFERSYNMAPYSNLVLGFAKTKASDEINDKVVSYDDKVLGTGKINIKINSGDIKNIPSLKFE